MQEIFITGNTLPEVYHKSLLALSEHGEFTPCPDWNTNQKEISLTMVVNHPLEEPMISKMFIGGPHELEQYRQEMLDGILDFEVLRGNWAYTYHDRMEYQIDYVINELKRNPESRRAVIDIRRLSDMKIEEQPCLTILQYFIRNGQLYCKALFRSNDACKATFFNAFALILLQKRIAEELGVEVGTYTHRANSFHCYERDFKLLDGYVSRLKSDADTTYDYIGEWDELMEAEKASIAKMVEELRNK